MGHRFRRIHGAPAAPVAHDHLDSDLTKDEIEHLTHSERQLCSAISHWFRRRAPEYPVVIGHCIHEFTVYDQWVGRHFIHEHFTVTVEVSRVASAMQVKSDITVSMMDRFKEWTEGAYAAVCEYRKAGKHFHAVVRCKGRVRAR